MDADAGLSIAVDPLSGAAVSYWDPIKVVYDWTSPSSIP
jgi:hypothetical protein